MFDRPVEIIGVPTHRRYAMQGKVEICGVNTARLKTLSHSEMDTLLRLAKAGDRKVWERLIEAVSSAATDALESAQKLSDLHENNVTRLPKPARSKDNVRAVFDYLEQHPIIDIKRTASALGISYHTTATVVKKLQELGILKETTNSARNRVFAYEDYLQILRQGT